MEDTYNEWRNKGMRDYTITRQLSQLWECKVIDSYGQESVNWFETKEECHKQVLYTWETEKSPEDSKKAQDEAIRKMVDRDEINGKIY